MEIGVDSAGTELDLCSKKDYCVIVQLTKKKKKKNYPFNFLISHHRNLHREMLWLGAFCQLSVVTCFHLMHSTNFASSRPLVQEVSEAHGVEVGVTELVSGWAIQDRLSLGYSLFILLEPVLLRTGRVLFCFVLFLMHLGSLGPP